jgi:hypothetical protein
MATGKVGQQFSNWREELQDWFDGGTVFKVMTWILLVIIVSITVMGWYWSREPDLFTIEQSTQRVTAESREVVGVATTSALLQVMETLLDKPGGYTHNDRLPPGVMLDNMPIWEYGALIQVRDLSRAMREYYSRSQSQSREDEDLSMAEPRFNFQANSWVLPASESEYRDGMTLVESYLARLTDEQNKQAQFYARADNLHMYLGMVSSRLGSLSQRLSASVGQARINTDLAGDSAATQATSADQMTEVKTSWFEIDDIFYEARGSSWALIHFLKAVEKDFAGVLQKKNALISLRQIIRELEETQGTIYSPIILNGSGFGLVANHSLVMASYVSRANAAIIDLRDLLSRG